MRTTAGRASDLEDQRRIARMVSRSPLAKRLLDVLAANARDGDEAFDAATLVLATAVHLELGDEPPPATPLSGIAKTYVGRLADHFASARPDLASSRKQHTRDTTPEPAEDIDG
jgi:hypothetical protein